MGPQRRKFPLTIIRWIVVCTLTWLMGACSTAPTATPTPASSLQVTFAEAPVSLCQAATQIRLAPKVTGQWPQDAKATWTLTAADDGGTTLSHGEWQPVTSDLLAAFPGGVPMSPGHYRITMHLEAARLASHTFTVNQDTARITGLTLAMSPNGPEIARLEDNIQHFYLRYTYQDACLGTPYWVSVYHNEAVVCTHNATLPQESGTVIVACYHKDGAPFENGDYHAQFTMMGETLRNDTVRVGVPPVTPTATPTPMPTPTPTPHPKPVCDPLFTSAGLTSAGTPFLPQDRFEWYSQVIYAGTQCSGLSNNTPWQTEWYRNGTRIQAEQGLWTGAAEGTVWDSITGTPDAPFLIPGTYTVTLTLTDTTLTTEFRLIPYVRPTLSP